MILKIFHKIINQKWLLVGLILFLLFGGKFVLADPIIEYHYFDDLYVCRNRPLQMVVFSFDGSRSLEMWEKTISVANEVSAYSERPVHFTYFVSGVYFLSEKAKKEYQTPVGSRGESLIGFAKDERDIARRIELVNRAIADGHEIGSHLNGHYNGQFWTEIIWDQEFKQFKRFFLDSGNINKMNLANRQDFKINLLPSLLAGFRAPELAVNQEAWSALLTNGYLYDSSTVAIVSGWPHKTIDGLWHFPLAQIEIVGQGEKILPIDYNFFLRHSDAKNFLLRNSIAWQKAYQETKFSYLNYFFNNYFGDRRPVYIVNHFSNWNDGLYWNVTGDLIKLVCSFSDVRCVSYIELLDYVRFSN